MPLYHVEGDPMLTRAQTLAFGHNAKGRTEMGDLETRLMRHYPTAFSTYTRQAKRGKRAVGSFYKWEDTQPQLLFLTVRASSVGATRLRYVQSILITIARDYRLYNLQSLAIAPLGNPYEYAEIRPLYDMWLRNIALPVVVYDAYQPDVLADEPFA